MEVFYFVLGMLYEFFCNLSVEPIKRKWRRECNYDCTKCRVWDCDKHLCNQQYIKDLKKGRKTK